MTNQLKVITRVGDIHEDRPEFHTVSFIAETWGRMTLRYNIRAAEGIRYIAGQYDDGITFGKIKRNALTPGPGGGTAWGYTP